MGLKPIYSYPQMLSEIPINGGISVREIEETLITYKDIKLVVITSPTYEGVVSEIEAIAEVVHRHGGLLLVDEAHGAHFGFHKGFPQSAVGLGADLVIQSLHKTLPALTQTAILHSNRAELKHKLMHYLAIYQTSSPSYLLLSGIDRCISVLEDRGKELFDVYYGRLIEFYRSMEDLRFLKLLTKNIVGQSGVYDLDPSKITVSVRDIRLTGHQLQEILREKYHIVMEMEAPDYVLGMTSICDTKEGFDRLAQALLTIDSGMAELAEQRENRTEQIIKQPVQVMVPQEATEIKSEVIKLVKSTGRISAVFVSLFPPGSPVLVPGERIDKDFIDYISFVKQEGITITGLVGKQKDEIEVVCRTEKGNKNG
jgi:arginine/lysine/ornithine decarboxylase